MNKEFKLIKHNEDTALYVPMGCPSYKLKNFIRKNRNLIKQAKKDIIEGKYSCITFKK